MAARIKIIVLNLFVLFVIGPNLAFSYDIIVLASASGEVDPITYTTADGTFTTSTIAVTLDPNSTSYFDINYSTGSVQAHTVFDLTFNDGQGDNLTGVLTLNESGVLGPLPILMNIDSGILAARGHSMGRPSRGKTRP